MIGGKKSVCVCVKCEANLLPGKLGFMMQKKSLEGKNGNANADANAKIAAQSITVCIVHMFTVYCLVMNKLNLRQMTTGVHLRNLLCAMFQATP